MRKAFSTFMQFFWKASGNELGVLYISLIAEEILDDGNWITYMHELETVGWEEDYLN